MTNYNAYHLWLIRASDSKWSKVVAQRGPFNTLQDYRSYASDRHYMLRRFAGLLP